MKKKLLRILFLIIMFFGIVPATSFANTDSDVHKVHAVNHTGGYVYFLKPSTWTEDAVMMFIGKDSYTSVYSMKKVENTDNLYRYTMPTWDGATYVAFANANSAWESGNWGPSNRTNAPNYTNVYNNYGFNSGSYYVCVPASTANNAGITINYKSSASALNLTTRANVVASTADNLTTYSSNAAAGTVSVSGYYMSAYSTASARAAVSSTATTAYASTTLAPGSTATFTATAKDGYKFVGWSTSSSEANIVSTEETYKFAYDISYTAKTVYALFKPESYTVTLKPGENATVSIDTVEVCYDGNYPKLPTPERLDLDPSYVFIGWFEENGETEVTSTTKYTTPSDSYLYAHWEKLKSCTVTLKSDGFEDQEIEVFETKPYSFRDNSSYFDISRSGYDFKGWFNSDGVQIDENSEVPENPTNHTLTAKWELITYSINYNNIDNTNNDSINEDTFTIESETFTIKAPTKEFYTFLGWTGTDLDSPTNTITIEKGSTGNRTYTANWECKVTIYLDFSGVKDWYGDESSKAYWPFIYFWNSSTNTDIGWNYSNGKSNENTRFEYLSNNLYKYEIDFLDSKLANLQEINNFIIGFYFDWDGDSNTHQNPLQTTNITFPISYQNNGQEYRIIYDTITSSSWTSDSKLNNFTMGEVINNIHYMDEDKEIYTLNEPIYTPSFKDYPYFKEKEGYKLEGWYTDSEHLGDEKYLFEHKELLDSNTPSELYLYANYVEANDYYIYIDAKDMAWKPEYFSVYKWNDYFNGDIHNNSWPGVTEDTTYLGNGIYRVYVDSSKSFDKLIFCDTENYVPGSSTVPQTEDIIMSPTNSYYVISPKTTTNSSGKTVFKIIYEQTLDNFLVAQKNTSSDINAFRFTSGLLNSYEDNVNDKNKEFGFKFIFVKNDSSYVGYWNFEKSSILDCIRYDGILYEAGVDNSYKGYYSLQLSDDITFKYQDYDQIIVIACYRDDSQNTQIIKAQEYNITMIDGTVYLYEIER